MKADKDIEAPQGAYYGSPAAPVAPAPVGPAPYAYPQAASAAPPSKGGMSIGGMAWLMFGLGFIFPVLWVLCWFVPVWARSTNASVTDKDRKHMRGAAIASGVMFAIMIILIIVAVAITASATHQIYSSYSYNSGSGCVTLYGEKYCA